MSRFVFVFVSLLCFVANFLIIRNYLIKLYDMCASSEVLNSVVSTAYKHELNNDSSTIKLSKSIPKYIKLHDRYYLFYIIMCQTNRKYDEFLVVIKKIKA